MICNLFIYKELKPYRTELEFSLSQGCPHIVRLNGYTTLPCISCINTILEAVISIFKHYQIIFLEYYYCRWNSKINILHGYRTNRIIYQQ